MWFVVAITAAAIELVGAGRRRAEATKKDRGSRIVIRVCAFPGVLLLVLSPRIAPAAEIRPPLVSAVVGSLSSRRGRACGYGRK
jgi:hypothetical protein